MSTHTFVVNGEWVGNLGTGTSGYHDYSREVTLRVAGKPDLSASAHSAFRGDAAKWNPEDMLIAALVECHMLSYLHAAVQVGVVVQAYVDEARGVMQVTGNAGSFTEVVLQPTVTVTEESMVEAAVAAHEAAHEWCFIANSVNFPVRIIPTVLVGASAA